MKGRAAKRLRRLQDDLRLRHRSTSVLARRSGLIDPAGPGYPWCQQEPWGARHGGDATGGNRFGSQTDPRRGAVNYNQERSYWSLDFWNQRDPWRHLVRTVGGMPPIQPIVRIAPGRHRSL